MSTQDTGTTANDTLPGPGSGGDRKHLTPWQRRLFLLGFSCVFTLVVLGAIEGVFRLAGYGGYPATFDEVGELPGGSTLVMTSHAGPGSYFFSNRSRAGSLERAAFISPKPEGTFRVFVVGASAAKGSPYRPPFTGASFLREMLADAWPERDVEVINLGTTAVASFPVLGMMTEALEYEPDLVVVYAGNNEFYGAYGVASLHSAGRSAGMIRLIRATRSTAIAQFIDSRLRGFDASESKTLMEAMVGQASIGSGDPARAAAAANLGAFIGDMIDRCQSRGVAVVVCTLPSNEAGIAPLGGSVVPGLDDAGGESLRQHLAEIDGLIEADPVAAGRAAETVLVAHPTLATAHHLRGRALRRQERFEDAAIAFGAAVDLDPMPWRPPSALIGAIRAAAEGRGVPLCDLQGEFRDASPGGVIGWALMDDHVHPSLRGQELVARSIVRTLATVGGGAAVDPDRLNELPSAEAYFERLGWNVYDEYAAAHAMRSLGEIPFYKESNPQFFERFDLAYGELRRSQPQEVVVQMVAWNDPATHKGGHRPISGMVGRAMYGLGRFEEADRLFGVAASAVTPYGSWELQYTYMMLLARQNAAGALDEADLVVAMTAIEHGRFLLSSGPTAAGGGERYMGELHQFRGEFAESIPYLGRARARLGGIDRVLADKSLVRAYAETGRDDDAQSVAEAGVRGGGRFVEYYLQMARELQGG